MKKALIIEDDPVIIRIYRTLLEREGYKVEVSPDGQTGLEQIRAGTQDVVLLDLMLPKLNGIGVLKNIRGDIRFKKIPIIVFTNAYLPGPINEALLAGATKVLNKATLNPRDILTALKDAISPPTPASSTDTVHESESPPGKVYGQSPEIVGNASSHRQAEFSVHREVEASGASGNEVQDETAEDLLVTEESGEMNDAEFRADLLKSFVESLPQIVADLRKLVQDLSKTRDQASRSQHLLELSRKMHGFTGGAGMAGFLNISTYGAMVEDLLKELREQPKSLNASTLCTLTQAIDFLPELGAESSGRDPVDQTNFEVMVVDDEILSRRTIVYSLGKAGLKATSVEDAPSALQLAAEKPFDLIVVDSQMADADGLGLAAKLQATQNNKNTPVLLVAPLTAFKGLGKRNSSSVPELIAKPFLFIELTVKALTSLLRGQQLRTSGSCEAERHAA